MSKYQKIGKENPIRLAFLGCGEITRRHSTYTRKADSNIALSYASRTFKKAEEYRKKYKGDLAFSSYMKAINSENVDIVMINTPPHLHFDLCKKGLEAGKHVIVEKPPFLRSSDFDELGSLAEEKNLQLMVAENYFYKPLRRCLEKQFKDSLIGDPLFMSINATKTQKLENDWREDKELTGFGSLYEGGIHWINIINNIGIEVDRVQAFVPSQKSELERSIQVSISSIEGLIINLLYSWEVSTIFKGLRLSKVFGREGSITFETNGVFVFVRGKKIRMIFPGFSDISGYKTMFSDFFVSLRLGKEPEFNWRDAQRDLQLIERIYDSI